jgi:hypothetical protein
VLAPTAIHITGVGKLRPAPAVVNMLGLITLGLAAAAALAQLVNAGKSSSPAHSTPRKTAATPAVIPESRTLHGSAALLAASVLADSALEHYRGEFKNPGMFTPLVTSLLTIVAGACSAASRSGRSTFTRNGIYVTAAVIGITGLAFHLYNILKRPGGADWLNVFYAAPLGAPVALSLAGLIGLSAQSIRNTPENSEPELLGWPAGRALSALTGFGLTGTSSEAALLHFRGAYQNPFMWLPVIVPPVTSALMAEAALSSGIRHRRFTQTWLGLTALLGIAGVGFHISGVSRRMGGWRNWSQNLLSGPPLPAPPSFSALALAGMAALSLSAKSNALPAKSSDQRGAGI